MNFCVLQSFKGAEVSKGSKSQLVHSLNEAKFPGGVKILHLGHFLVLALKVTWLKTKKN